MQNSLKFCTLIPFLLLFSSQIFANEPKMKASFSLVGMNMDYREYDDADILLDSEKSSFVDLIGFELGYEFYFLRDENSYSELNVDFMYTTGDTDYVGSLLGSNQGYGSYVGTTNNQIGDVDVSYRYNYIANNTLSLNCGIGLGYRYWLRSLSSTQEELYSWFSLRPSLGLDIKLFSGLSVSPKIEYQYGILPEMYANTLDYTFTLGSANITTFTIPLNYELNDNIELFGAYTFETQTIEKSNFLQVGSSYYYEPDSSADNQYLKFGVAFKY